VLGVACCSSAWPTATLGRTGWWAAATLGSNAGPSARGARAHGDGVTQGIAALACGGGAGASRLELMVLRCGLDGASTYAGVNSVVR
jgi:hypothetical protein